MRKSLYPRLAGINLINNRRLYIPYLLTSVGTAAMFYIICYMQSNPALDEMGGVGLGLRNILGFGIAVVGIFAVIFLFYTNSFIIKQRKKEFGLYNILGMEKRHIGRVISLEGIYIYAATMIAGLGLGVLFSRLMIMLMAKLMRCDVRFYFSVSLFGVAMTMLVFGGVFLLILLSNFIHIRRTKPVELLSGSAAGEKEPKAKWIFAVLGLLFLGGGYYLSVTCTSPIKALGAFFLAVILVILGTYCLFTAGSIALLKTMRRKKSFYYKPRHFTAVSGMIYRMKRNAVGLGNICILATMVLVMLSTTSSLYFGFEDAMRAQYPRNFEIEMRNISRESCDLVDEAVTSVFASHDVKPENVINYRYHMVALYQDGSNFSGNDNGFYSADTTVGVFIPLDEYNRMQGKSETLGAGEAIFFTRSDDPGFDSVSFAGADYKIVSRAPELNVEENYTSKLCDVYYFILPDEAAVADTWRGLRSSSADEWDGMSAYYGVDCGASWEEQKTMRDEIENTVLATDNIGYDMLNISSAAVARGNMMGIFGGLFFLGIFLGLVFIMATVMIIYYKQVSEGYDDKERFEIMQKVGMSRAEVRKTIRSQILSVFFIPLLAAIMHVCFAFPVISRLLALLNLTNVTLFILTTAISIAVFALLYTAVYLITARTYYKIVERK